MSKPAARTLKIATMCRQRIPRGHSFPCSQRDVGGELGEGRQTFDPVDLRRRCCHGGLSLPPVRRRRDRRRYGQLANGVVSVVYKGCKIKKYALWSSAMVRDVDERRTQGRGATAVMVQRKDVLHYVINTGHTRTQCRLRTSGYAGQN